MPRPATGNPHWKALAVKLPVEVIDELRRFSDLHGVTISQLIREGLDMRLHGPQQTTITTPTVRMLTRLATTLATAVEQLQSVCAGDVSPEEETRQGSPEPTSYNSNTEYNGNITPGTGLPPGTRLGKLCPKGHAYQFTGKSLRSNDRHGDCIACHKRKVSA